MYTYIAKLIYLNYDLCCLQTLHILCDGKFELAYFKTYILWLRDGGKLKTAKSLIGYHPRKTYGLVKVQNHALFILARCGVNERSHARPF